MVHQLKVARTITIANPQPLAQMEIQKDSHHHQLAVFQFSKFETRQAVTTTFQTKPIDSFRELYD